MERIAYCGLDCYECPIYIATINDDKRSKEALAVDCSTEELTLTADDMTCQGCHSDTLSDKICGQCLMRECAQPKDITTCAECGEFPCTVLKKYVPEDSDHWKRLMKLERV